MWDFMPECNFKNIFFIINKKGNNKKEKMQCLTEKETIAVRNKMLIILHHQLLSVTAVVDETILNNIICAKC